ncbi:hypothetical protein BDQ17DRAFT_737135 [Cyathus striatus]|nr:hypothetical protein BDQ17DRAFT_737135 [Cyathus striatus]
MSTAPPQTTLDALPDVFSNSHDAVKIAYRSIVLTENSVSGSSDNAIHLKTIKYLLHYLPSEQAQRFVADEVNRCHSDEDIFKLGEYYFSNFVLALKRDNGSGYQTPQDYLKSTNFMSRDKLEQKFIKKNKRAHITYTQAKKMALVREEFQCPITQCSDYNTDFIIHGSEPDYPNNGGVRTRCFHFVNLKVEAEEDRTFSFGRIMNNFSFEGLWKHLEGPNIHRLENVLTLQEEVSSLFENLELWLEPTPGIGARMGHTPTTSRCAVSPVFICPIILRKSSLLNQIIHTIYRFQVITT